MTEPMPEPTDHLPATDPWPVPPSMPLVFREGRLTPDGPYLLQINGVEVPRSLLDAVRKFTRSSAAEIEKLRAELHTAREHLRAGVEALTPGRLYAITGEATRADLSTLKDIADMASRHDVRIMFLAAGVAIEELESAEVDRLAEELRQQQLRQQLAEREVTDLRAENARLHQLLDGVPLPLAAVCARWHAGQHRSPDCKAGSHPACSGDGWCDIDDQQVPCSCACHQPAAVA